ncbi:PREDICTED: LOW QUALITY PROTEIN: nudC domain-containing protein 3, partial [Galeopterus variegatus]|uniref:LOW QUALITY PROTEIN: nudC domain-containing protein 3 n=1 Tax=Galeopterus variegatus TaxID=482537 RepID=A0ABM0R0F0_GALVR
RRSGVCWAYCGVLHSCLLVGISPFLFFLRIQEQFQKNPDSYNGAVRENYTWSQDYTDLEVRVPVPKHVVKGKQVSVSLSSSSIRVAMLEENRECVLMEGKLTHKINTESSLWSLEPGKCVLVNLSKVGEYWWNAILEGEEPIDIDKINKERSMATVDEEEQAVLDRLTFDYHQKLQGKPQSHELKVHEMLKKGWDAEGSPFRGQRFDPAMFSISPGAVQFNDRKGKKPSPAGRRRPCPQQSPSAPCIYQGLAHLVHP